MNCPREIFSLLFLAHSERLKFEERKNFRGVTKRSSKSFPDSFVSLKQLIKRKENYFKLFLKIGTKILEYLHVLKNSSVS